MGGEVGRKNGRTKKTKEIASSSGKEPPDIHKSAFKDIFGATDSDRNEGAGPHEASGEEESEDQSDEATDHYTRPSIYKAGRNISGKRLPRRRRGVPDAQSRVQPQNTTVPTKCAEASN